MNIDHGPSHSSGPRLPRHCTHIQSIMKTTSLLLALVGASSGYMVQAPFSPSAVTEIPLNGFGTWNLKGDNTSEVVSAAMQAGYRHIDCATAYGNQKAVGKGLADGAKAAGLSRSDFWVTSKLWNDQYACLPTFPCRHSKLTSHAATHPPPSPKLLTRPSTISAWTTSTSGSCTGP